MGAEVSNIDLSKPVPESSAAILKQAHAEHGVLVFPDQQISSDDLKRFGRLFGDLTVHPFSTSTEESPELIVYDNKEGNPRRRLIFGTRTRPSESAHRWVPRCAQKLSPSTAVTPRSAR